MSFTRLVVGFGVVLSAASPAFAQAPAPTVSADASVSTWAPEIALRPPTLNAGMLEVHGSLPIFKTGGTFGDDTLILGGGGVSYGVSNELELGGDYAFEVSPEVDAGGVFAGHLLYRLTHNDQMSAALGAGLRYSHAADDAVIFTGGVAFRYRLNKQVSIFSNTSGMPLCGSCLQLLGPVTGQFLVARSGDTTGVVLNLPVGVGFQVSPELYLFGETVIATFILSPESAHINEFSDYIGLHAGAWYSASKQLELGAGFGDDLKNASDIYLIELRARIFL